MSTMPAIPPPPLHNDLSSESSSSDEDMAIRSPRTRSRLRSISTAAGVSSPLFRSLRRQRLWTADTVPIQNTSQKNPKLTLNRSLSSSLGPDSAKAAFRVTPDNPTAPPYTMRSDINPFVTFDDDSNHTAPQSMDEQSTVSSISNDSARRYPKVVVPDDHRLPVPTEIYIRTCQTSDESLNSSETSFPVSSWQKSWVEGGGVACIDAYEEQVQHERVKINRPSPLTIASRNQSCSTETAETAKYRLHAPRNMVLYDSQGCANVTYSQPTKDKECMVESLDDMSLSPKSTVHRVITDATSRASGSTSNMNHSPYAIRRPRIARTTLSPSLPRETLVFRPLMKRAFTTQAPTALLAKPKPALRHQSQAVAPTDASVASSLLGGRPRRKPVHGSDSVFSFGSIVGQSSLLTPTSTVNGSMMELQSPVSTVKEFEQLVKANQRLNQHVAHDTATEFIPPLHKSGLHQDFEYVWKQVRRWTGTTGHLDLQRNRDGCLT